MVIVLHHKAAPSLDVAYSEEDDGEDEGPCGRPNEEYFVLHALSQSQSKLSLTAGPASKPSIVVSWWTLTLTSTFLYDIDNF